MSDERYQRVNIELSRHIELLHEEQERVVKIESIKKSLEIEIKNVTVRLEEVEANALVNGKRIISKLEGRVSHQTTKHTRSPSVVRFFIEFYVNSYEIWNWSLTKRRDAMLKV